MKSSFHKHASMLVLALLAPMLHASDKVVRYANDHFRFQLHTEGFRYGFEDANGKPVASAHPESGLLLGLIGENTSAASPVQSTVVDEFKGNLLRATVTTAKGIQARVKIEFHESYARFEVVPLGQPKDARFTFDFRTAAMSPVYGLGDYGSHADEFKNVNAPCNGNVGARDQADLTGLVRDEVINQGSCRRFVTNFAIFPKQGFAQVLFNNGKKRVGFTQSENRIGVADVTEIKTLYYFTGDMKRIYADYLAARVREGYPDVKPRYALFEVGWEAYGALGWDTFQEAVMDNIRTYLKNGYPLKWGVIGSGFWPGDRKKTSQGTTVSFGMWDKVETPRRDGLPNPRYPDPAELKQLFRDNGMKLLLGLRNHFKDPAHASYNLQNDGVFPQQALDAGFLLKNRNGNLVRSTINEFPRVPVHFIDSHNRAAMDWFVKNAALWSVDGFKEDAMIYDRMYHDGMWNPFNKRLMDEGYLMIARNTAFSSAGDLMRINDSYAGTGKNYHTDPHRMPLNMLNNAASAASNGYPDIIGGTPVTSTTSRMFREYYVRNAMLAAVSAGMSFGRGPWLLEHPEYEAIALKAARWHDRYAPYIFSAAIDSHETGYPHTMTPLHIAYPDDPETYNLISRERQQYQWMLGPSMLAAPLFGNDFETAESRDVYLPAGRWIDYESGTVHQGPTTLKNFPMPRARIPVFIGGKGVLVGKSADVPDALDAEVFPVTRGSSEYTYTWTDGTTKSRITSNNAGWNPATLKIRDLTADLDVVTEFDPVRGSFRFRLEPGHDYELRE
jgi:alpha-glucosidase (family GH31 glycosyl hydrolase)